MKLSFSSPGKASSRNSVVFWLLCLIICYQAAYQICMTFVLSHDNSTLDPWCSGAQHSAQQCVEAELFQGWHSAGPLEPTGAIDALGLLESEDELNGLLEHHTATILHRLPSTTPTSPAEATTHAHAAATQVQSPLAARHLHERVATSSTNVSTAAMAASDNSSLVRRPLTPWSKGLVALQERLEERMRHRTAERAAKLHAWSLHRQERRLHEAHSAIKEFHNMSSLSRDLKALHDRFGARLSARRDHTQSAKAEFGSLTSWAKDVQDLQKHFESEFVPHDAMAPPQADNMTAWSQNLSALQHRMETRMDSHNKAHHMLEEHERSRHHHHVPEAKKENGHALLEQIAALGREMCSDAKHHHDPHCAQFRASAAVPSTSATPKIKFLAKTKFSSLDEAEAQLNGELHQLAEKQHDWEKSFVAKVSNTMHDFCSDSVHRTQPTCVQFLSHEATSNMASKKKAWHQSFKAKIANVGHELCNNPMRREYAICKKFFADKEHDAKSDGGKTALSTKSEGIEDDDEVHGAITKSPHERLELHWSAVIQSSQLATKELHGPVEMGNVATVGDVSRLRTSAHWSGRIPSVACITLVPEGSAAKAMMQYFIDNFRLQHYEGEHQLVLVYHHTDKQAAELVHKYADGTYIQGVVARGEDFPSASAFRFGAWVARDSDIIARWDFSAWHHPHRLSQQVRSLALAGRPASLLERWTIMDKAGANTTAQDGEHWDSSLLGEAAWMRAKWYPFMDEVDAFPAQDLVKLDDASLQVFEEATL